MSLPSRREVLLAGASVTLLGCPTPSPTPDAGPPTVDAQAFDQATRVAFAPEAIAAPLAAFPQAVASGAMEQATALVVTRAPTLPRVVLRVWRPLDSSTEVALVTEQALDVPTHGAVKARVRGLAPATTYRYAFFAPDFSVRSAIGAFRTAFPDDWLEPVTFGTTSCAKLANGPFKALSLQAQVPMDFFVHLGDVSYNDGAVALEEFRDKWRGTLADEGYRALLPAVGTYLTWDDHDFWNNFDPEVNGATDGRFLDARQAFLESLPTELSPEGRLWRSFRWGRTVEVFVVDSRTERRASTRLSADPQYLSRAQLDWLKAGLADSPCHFKVVMSSVPITTMPPPLWGGQADRWQGYPAARSELLEHLVAADVKNVWFLGGDFHLGLVMRLDGEGPNARFMEIAGGPAGHGNPLSLVLEPGQEANREIAFPQRQFLFASGDTNATTLTLDPKADTVRVVFQGATSGRTTFDQVLRFGG